ncbi:amino acid permease [Aminipila luticellarii]|uniref:Amino acid permease n=1 Tax=Aminipila luticellarii TaxID=2507160 RepID=A0A410PTV2_9FIRM|nr:amino acid permease [Aminipila luticellarii]QAT42339.1 amino acid permease [Aminipila luticellarii]
MDKIIGKDIEKTDNLNRALKLPAVVMVSMGGTVGTGLFLGSGYVMQNAGPGGTLIAYLFGGVIMYLMMLCLGELMVAKPVAGGVQAYATEMINPAMGFTVGWIKTLAYALTASAQLVASSIIIGNIFPQVPSIYFIAAFILLFIVMNMGPVDKAGNSGFVFSSIKFFLVISFILVGSAMILGIGFKPTGFSNMVNDGGFFPVGIKGIVMTMMSAAFAFGGADLCASAAGEAENPEKTLPKVINWTIWGLIVCYIVSFVILLAILPWRTASLNSSPFADVFKLAGFHSGELIVNVCVLTSALSSGNAFVFACTRSLWSMGSLGQAPSFLSKLSRKKVPVAALITTMVVASLAVISAFVAKDTVYLFLQSVIGIANVFTYTLYAACLMIFRKAYVEEQGSAESLKYKTPFYPITPVLLITMCAILFIGMFFDPSQKLALMTGIPTLVLLYGFFSLYQNVLKKSINK